jgi:tripartite-type tricarboxylate transporter receptor subunit TctC
VCSSDLSLGNGSSAHLTMALFMAEAGFGGTHSPFNGSPPAALALAQGEADAGFMTAPALLPHVRAGRVRLLATSGAQRAEGLKELPTLAESGWPAVVSLAWNGVFTAAGTPPAVVARINADVNAALREPALTAALTRQDLSVAGGSPEDFKRLIEADARRWGAIIRRAGITLD